ncbi:hypothetical protein [Chondromyces apiculatus]|uniref:Outer membrane component of tripartite multidrug resistance system n=1 Tax=Chondromyces apiculatus DSM 436 TaxID=1192034 RepID=A0A017TEG3_9BACT|nr:hypothetical protein [Chondromyces apiculatus]EYF07678.1 Outer membrane component of tripartite multidrug resistance system [Chondromyces apiculatus DSM 436]
MISAQKLPRPLLLTTLAGATLAVLATLRPATADPVVTPPLTSTTAMPLASATAMPLASATATPGAPLPLSLQLTDWPASAPSERPTPTAWEQAPAVSLTRLHRSCRAARLREWLRVTCHVVAPDGIMSLRVLGGSDEGVALADAPPRRDPDGSKHEGVHVVLPVRPGDRRVLQIALPEFPGLRSYTPEENGVLVISALWLPGATGPTIVVD